MNSSMSPTAIDQSHWDNTPAPNPAAPPSQQPYDLVCVGFGPAALAIAVALHDTGVKRQVLFLERQPQFAWHSGMLLPSAKMQISFLKDLATFRDPRSHFTFLNYLKEKDRLAPFTNLSTFLPRREEFNDYLTWAAEHFDDQVRYGSETKSISPIEGTDGTTKLWNVTAKDIHTEELLSFAAKKVVVAVGGFPKLPRALQSFGPKIVHSSQYMKLVPSLLPDTGRSLRVAVVGGGQSAAEIFEDLMERYPHVRATLFTASTALKPSDDSPFVNEIFDPERVDEFYSMSRDSRKNTLMSNRATNYSVVRPELIDRLYEWMYHQRLHEPDEQKWKHRIIGSRELAKAEQTKDGRMSLEFRNPHHGGGVVEEHGFDLVITGTGYVRNAHETLLRPVEHLFEGSANDVDRDYRLRLKAERVGGDCGIWLQGCCEQSHGLSDTLLSILAVRGGEIVDSIFGDAIAIQQGVNGKKKVLANGHANGNINGCVSHTNGKSNGFKGNTNGTTMLA